MFSAGKTDLSGITIGAGLVTAQSAGVPDVEDAAGDETQTGRAASSFTLAEEGPDISATPADASGIFRPAAARSETPPPDAYDDALQDRLSGALEREGFNVVARTQIAVELASQAVPGQPILIRGIFRTGKTVLAGMVARSIGDDTFIRGYHAFKYASFEFAIEIVTREVVAKLIRAASNGEIEDINTQMASSGMMPLQFFDDWLEKRGRFAVVVFDEVMEVLPWMAGQLRNGFKRIYPIVVVHYLSSTEDLVLREFTADTRTHWVRSLDLSETAAYLEAISKRNPRLQISFSPDAVEHIYGITGGHVLQINNILYLILDDYSEPPQPLEVTVEKIDSVFGYDENMDRAVRSVPSVEQKFLLLRLALGAELSSSGHPDDILAPFISMGLVTRDDVGRLHIVGEHLRHVIKTKLVALKMFLDDGLNVKDMTAEEVGFLRYAIANDRMFKFEDVEPKFRQMILDNPDVFRVYPESVNIGDEKVRIIREVLDELWPE